MLDSLRAEDLEQVLEHQPDTAEERFRTIGSICAVRYVLAERGGFEPPEPFGSSAFKAGAFVRSATVPSTTLTLVGEERSAR